MKQRFFTLITGLALLVGLFAFQLPAAAAPVDVFQGDACNKNTSVCGNGDNDALYKIVKNIINTLFLAAGIISVVMIIVGGINYAISSGDNAKVASAKNTVLYAVIGLIVTALAFPIVNFVTDVIL